MKKLNKFYAENNERVNAMNENKQSSCRGGRFSKLSILDSITPSKSLKSKMERLSEGKRFNSLSEVRAFMLTGK